MQTLRDDEEVSFVSGRTRMFAIIGHPIDQVRSPEMFTAEFVRRNANALLIPMHIRPEDFETSMRQILRFQNFDGFVFTIPFKQAAVKFTDRLGDQARIVGAINALARRDEEWVGDIFDGLGCVEGFRRRGYSMRGKRLMLIGAGGAGSAIGVAAAYESPRTMRVFDLDAARANDLADKIHRVDPDIEVTVDDVTIDGIDILLNASPVGMLGDKRVPVDVSAIDPDVIVFDAVVKPEMTGLLTTAQQRGCRIVLGREMMRGQMSRMVDFFGYPRA